MNKFGLLLGTLLLAGSSMMHAQVEQSIKINLPKQAEEILKNGGRISVAIIDPLTDAPGVYLAMDGCENTTQPVLNSQ